SKSIERVHSYRYLGSPINTPSDAIEAISGGIAIVRRQLMKIGPILRRSVLAVQTKHCLKSDSWPQLQDDTKGKGAGKESFHETPRCCNAAKVPEPMDWIEQTKTETNKEATKRLPDRTSR
ncbi:unnamed protein product, partial [Hymenolepis diminuta]